MPGLMLLVLISTRDLPLADTMELSCMQASYLGTEPVRAIQQLLEQPGEKRHLGHTLGEPLSQLAGFLVTAGFFIVVLATAGFFIVVNARRSFIAAGLFFVAIPFQRKSRMGLRHACMDTCVIEAWRILR